MKSILNLFKIRKNEKIPVLIMFILFTIINSLVVYKYYDIFTRTYTYYKNIFVHYFQISGFDPITYAVLSDWNTYYNVFRHPLLAFFMFPLYLINSGLIWLTNINCAVFIVAILLIVCATYSFVFIYRIFKDVLKLGQFDSMLLSILYFSFAYILVTITVPDHFAFSMLFLLFTIYLAGIKMQQNECFKYWQTIVLFVLTAGVTLSNGVKTYIYELFVGGRKFFKLKHLIFVVVVPPLMMWLFCQQEYRIYVWPHEHEQALRKMKQAKSDQQKIFDSYADSTGIRDSATIAVATKKIYRAKIRAIHYRNMKDPWNANQGKSIKKEGFWKWTDISTPRIPTIVENLLGESMQFHKQHFMEDVLRGRPVIVEYDSIFNYIIEFVIVVMFFIGIFCGRKSRFLWMCITGSVFDMILHLVIGFGINEVYIMSAHWLFVIPISIGFMMKVARNRLKLYSRSVLMAVTLFLLTYNSWLFVGFLLK